MFEKMLKQKGFWAKKGSKSDIVISSRLRLARNISGMAFPDQMDNNQAEKVRNKIKTFIKESEFGDSVYYYEIKEIPDIDRRFLRERNILTGEIESSSKSALILDKNNKFSILINEDDHIRIQLINPGLNLSKSYKKIDDIDNEFNKYIKYSFSKEYGYLTSSLNNTGTGLKVSVLMHLPMMTIMKSFSEIKKLAREIECEITPVTGDSSKNFGSIYLISNKYALGKSENEILNSVEGLISTISDLENEIRDDYIFDSKLLMEDRVWRSFGIMKYARNITYSESLEYLSNLRIGVILSIIKEIPVEKINDLMVKMQTAHLEKIRKENFISNYECDEYRADFLRKELPEF